MRKLLFICTIVLIFCGLLNAPLALAAEQDWPTMIEQSAAYLQEQVPNPTVASAGGEWLIMGLALSGLDVDSSYFDSYYHALNGLLSQNAGVLHDKKYTEYSRVVLALTALGKNVRQVGDYDLLLPLADYNQVIWQGLNGPIWALIALDSGNYPVPSTDFAIAAGRQNYIDYILDKQLTDGGFSLNSSGTVADPDITAMALIALAPYQEQAAVKQATDAALNALSAMQSADGSFSSFGSDNFESMAQVIVALSSLGIDYNDSRFVKDGQTVVDNLLKYRLDDGSFVHIIGDDQENLISTEQGLLAMIALDKAAKGLNPLYQISSAPPIDDNTLPPVNGLSGKHQDIQILAVTETASFNDISDNAAVEQAVIALASRNIIEGKSADLFAPDDGITRAEFAALLVRSLGITAITPINFNDVSSSSWYYDAVSTAASYGLITGRSAEIFAPLEQVSKQEAAVMISRAATLAGMNTDYDIQSTRNQLASFSDYVLAASWAQPALAFCYYEGILDKSELAINPNQAASRGDIALMLYNFMLKAQLIN